MITTLIASLVIAQGGGGGSWPLTLSAGGYMPFGDNAGSPTISQTDNTCSVHVSGSGERWPADGPQTLGRYTARGGAHFEFIVTTSAGAPYTKAVITINEESETSAHLSFDGHSGHTAEGDGLELFADAGLDTAISHTLYPPTAPPLNDQFWDDGRSDTNIRTIDSSNFATFGLIKIAIATVTSEQLQATYYGIDHCLPKPNGVQPRMTAGFTLTWDATLTAQGV